MTEIAVEDEKSSAAVEILKPHHDEEYGKIKSYSALLWHFCSKIKIASLISVQNFRRGLKALHRETL